MYELQARIGMLWRTCASYRATESYIDVVSHHFSRYCLQGVQKQSPCTTSHSTPPNTKYELEARYRDAVTSGLGARNSRMACKSGEEPLGITTAIGKRSYTSAIRAATCPSKSKTLKDYASSRRAATCFLRDRTPGIQVPPSPVHSMSKARLTIRRLPSQRNWLPSAMMSVTMRSTHS